MKLYAESEKVPSLQRKVSRLFMCMNGGVFVFALCLCWCGVCLWVCSNLGKVRGVASWAGNEAHLDLITSPLLNPDGDLSSAPDYSVVLGTLADVSHAKTLPFVVNCISSMTVLSSRR